MNGSTPAFNHVDAEALMALHDRHGVVVPRGRVLYRQGETTSELYVVLRGSVQLVDDAGDGPRVIGPGGYFGEYACFGREPRRFTAVVREDDTALLVFTQTTAAELLRESPRFVIDIVNALAGRLLELEFERDDLRRALGRPAAARHAGS
jgi:CRP-like cAMP-binding protein